MNCLRADPIGQSPAPMPFGSRGCRGPSSTLSSGIDSRQRPGLLRLRGMPMRPYRDIATVAALQVVCFSVLAHFEPQFFLLHLYQTIIYVALLILLFYMEDRWAFMIGMLAPVAWLGMVFATGLLGGATRSEEHTSELQSRFDLVCRLLLEKKKK